MDFLRGRAPQYDTKEVEKGIYLIVKFLAESERRPISIKEIRSGTGINLVDKMKHHQMKAIVQSLTRNPKVAFQDGYLIYKTQHNIRGKRGLLELLRHSPNGLPFTEIEDSYPHVASDVQQLHNEGKIRIITNDETKVDVLFFVSSEYPDMSDFVDMWTENPVPDIADLEKAMKQYGIRPFSTFINAPTPGKTQKKKRKSKFSKVTNSHIPNIQKILAEL